MTPAPMPFRIRADRRAGFTLLELLLATMLTAVIIGAAYEAYLGSLKAARDGTEAMDQYQAARAALQVIADDCRSAVMSNGVFGFGLVGRDGGEGELLSDELELSCTAPVRWQATPEGFDTDPPPPRTDFREVSYRVVTAEEAELDLAEDAVRPPLGLIREVRTNLTSADADERRTDLLSRAVVALQFEYFNGTDWVVDWDAGALSQMPLAVRITLAVAPSEDYVWGDPDDPPMGDTLAEMYPEARTFTTVVNLPTASLPEGSEFRVVGPGLP